MYTVERDLCGFAEIHEDGRRVAQIALLDYNRETDLMAATRLVEYLNRGVEAER